MYHIDLATIVQILQGFDQNSIVRADLPTSLLKKANCRAELEMVEGKITYCQIIDAEGSVLMVQDQAMKLLYRAGQLDWFVSVRTSPSPQMFITPRETPPPVSNIQNTPASRFDSGGFRLPITESLGNPQGYQQTIRIPRHVYILQQEQTQGWSRKHRSVYSLIDGFRSVDKIQSMLRMPFQDLEEILRDFQFSNLITYE